MATVVALKEWLDMDQEERLREQERRFQVIAEALAGLPHLRTE